MIAGNEIHVLLSLTRTIDDKIDLLSRRFDEHLTKDEAIWAEVAKHNGQIGAVRWLLIVLIGLVSANLVWFGFGG